MTAPQRTTIVLAVQRRDGTLARTTVTVSHGAPLQAPPDPALCAETGKEKLTAPAAARRAQRSESKRLRLQSYRCHFCGMWHMSSLENDARRDIRRDNLRHRELRNS